LWNHWPDWWRRSKPSSGHRERSPPSYSCSPAAKIFIFNTDASNVGIRWELSQVQNGQERVIAYYSKTLNKAKRNWCITWRELLVIVRTLEFAHNYLYRQEFHLHPRPLCVNLAHEFLELWGINHLLYSVPTGVQLHFRAPSRPKSTMPMTFHDNHVKMSVATATKSKRG
jgi:hypothetical protein